MTFNNVNGQVFGSGPGGWVSNPANVITLTAVPPSTAATDLPIGTIGIYPATGAVYVVSKNTGINGTVTWNLLGGAPSIYSGTATLVAGTVTVNTAAISATSIVMLTRQGVGLTGAAGLGILAVGTIVAGTSFDINAWQVADATALQASDVSVVGWTIIN